MNPADRNSDATDSKRLYAQAESLGNPADFDARHADRSSEGPAVPSEAIETVLARLRAHGGTAPSFPAHGEIGRGGMGVVYQVWDDVLRRDLALKMLKEIPAGDKLHGERVVRRFLDEAQITGQLNHPGIVPVHELGLDPQGRAYFTMRLVRGNTFRNVIEWVASGHEGWNLTRAITVLIQACDALAYAHSKGVVHRDLKPDNLMVGRFGETYVMDWGLARVLGAEDKHDVRVRYEAVLGSAIETERTDLAEKDQRSPLLSMDGDILGTAHYMSPEQAQGKIEQIDRRSDVYSMGAVLYDLLAQRPPYHDPEARMRSHDVVALVRAIAPKPLHELAINAPAELVAICEKAMARTRENRYADTRELAADLRAFVEQRVVRAYETGAVAELRKWVQRNKSLATSVAAVVLLLVGASVYVAWQRDQHGRVLSEKNTALQMQSQEVENARNEVQQKLDDVTRLSDIKKLRDLKQRANALWPAWPEQLPESEMWLAEAQALADRLPEHEASLKRLRSRGRSATAVGTSITTVTATSAPASENPRVAKARAQRAADLAVLDEALASRLEAMQTHFAAHQDGSLTHPADPMATADARKRSAESHLRALAAKIAAVQGQRREVNAERQGLAGATSAVGPHFADVESQWWHEQMSELVADLTAFRTELELPEGLQGDVTEAWRGSGDEALALGYLPTEATIAAVRRRTDHARWLARVSEEAVGDWTEAIERIGRNPRYQQAAGDSSHSERRNLELTEQMGLVPLGPDPESGFEEFWHIESGARPKRDASTDHLIIDDASGLVFVLLPGGTFHVGARLADAEHPLGSPNVDPESADDERPVHELTLAAFFLSKFEMTQAQWLRIAGANPSRFKEKGTGTRYPLTSPVEQVSFDDCDALVRRMGLAVPSEAQWEYGTRGGTTTVWWCGDLTQVAQAGNVADKHWAAEYEGANAPEPWDDGFGDVAPVGKFRPNAFGLHDVIGNVWEWCADEYETDAYEYPVSDADGKHLLPPQRFRLRVIRGGGWGHRAKVASSSDRYPVDWGYSGQSIGIRPTRIITE